MMVLIPIPIIPTMPIIGQGVRVLVFREIGSESGKGEGKVGKERKMARVVFSGYWRGTWASSSSPPSFLRHW
jgi:hypothetical protein